MAADDRFGPVGELEVNQAGDLAVAVRCRSAATPTRTPPCRHRATCATSTSRRRSMASTRDVLVGGETAFNVDFFDIADTYTPIVFVFVLGLSFLLLTVVFRSIVLPVKAIIMNLLSVGAAYGLVVLFFQQGVGRSSRTSRVPDFPQVEAIEAWLPLFLFSVLFGLSMDYHVFLLIRIREHFDFTGNNTESVAYGLRTTGGLITGAALIMVAVFGGFAAGRLVPLQQMGFGLAVAVFLDATIVRSVLVPSVDEAARGPELVPAEVARVAAQTPGRGPRGRARAGPGPRSRARGGQGRRLIRSRRMRKGPPRRSLPR